MREAEESFDLQDTQFHLKNYFWKASILHLVGIISKKEKEMQLAPYGREIIYVQLRCESAHRDSREKCWGVF